MPKTYGKFHLYGINELTRSLQADGGKYRVRVVEKPAGDWVLEVRSGNTQSSTLLGYLHDGKSSEPSSFSSRTDAVNEVLWADDYLILEFSLGP